MHESELKPCPFCGGQAHIAQYVGEFVRNAKHSRTEHYNAYCIECEQCGIQTLPDTIENLIHFWNTRYSA